VGRACCRLLRQLPGIVPPGTEVAISNDDHEAVILEPNPIPSFGEKQADDQIRVVRLPESKVVRCFRLAKNDDNALLPDGRIAALKGNTLRLYDTSGKLLRVLTREGPRFLSRLGRVRVAPDGRLMVSIEFTGDDDACAMTLWDIREGRMVRPLAGQGVPQRIQDVSFSPDGCWLVSVGAGDTVKMWDVRTGREVRKFLDPRREAVLRDLRADFLDLPGEVLVLGDNFFTPLWFLVDLLSQAFFGPRQGPITAY
jgi:WD40 repeat protein